MQEFKGTPGPWVIDANSVGSKWNIDALNGESVAISHQVANDRSWVKRDANTQLIAAAPELLEALRGVMSMFPVIEDDGSGRAGFTAEARDKLNAASAAITKALGQ